jgi:hypothetical protein
MKKLIAGVVVCASAAFVAVAPASASASITLDGSFSTVTTLQSGVFGGCPSQVADECGTMQLAGLGEADWVYDFGPTFEPNGHCFDVDGTLTITLQSDASTISGPLTGLFCPGPSEAGDQHPFPHSFGNPFVEDDIVEFTDGTGQFEGLSGTALFHTRAAGARFAGTLQGTLTG